jgi:hypothetical protein
MTVMISNALQLASKRQASVMDPQASSLFQAKSAFHRGYDHVPELAGERLRTQRQCSIPLVSVFLLVMAAISLLFEICGRLVGPVLLGRFGMSLDPFSLSVARQAIVTLLGMVIAGRCCGQTSAPAQRQHMLLTPLLALGVGLILAWLSQLAGQSGALDWLVILVYLVWAWGAAVSAVKA